MVVVLLIPIANNAWISLHEWSLVGDEAPRFIGLDNYVEILQTPRWRNTLLRTGLYVVLTVSAQVLLGFLIALLLHRHFPNAKVARMLLLMPMMISEVVVGNIWRLLLNFNGGLFNWFLGLVGIDPVFWLGPGRAFWSVVAVDIWQNTPFVTLVLFAAMQTLPSELLEAASIDGARRWQQVRSVIMPMIQPAFLLVLMFQTMFAIRSFSTIWLLTEGGPGNETSLLAIDVFRAALQSYDVGLGAALSWCLLLLSLGITILYIRWLKRDPLV
ncbi:carbohydrate ABC transporter permease [Jiangella asiatica]|nr:sugar ABC transporter permease [Jiangella asiatica]